ncbi:DUF3320 domain-containing protein [Poseidonocella sp. HB161398]|uniref:DUF3320 domain-containing protein n=1 Tax=Poseidonocella sp. HB161398 TaxID=2320855 RepID=UPI001107EDC0|nr:DUF3320 domain-containing protein [Poseidonocella sp. HB161398]
MEAVEPRLEQEDVLELCFDTSARVNFASAQNGVSILRTLSLANRGQRQLEGLTVTLESAPALLRPRSWTLDRLSPGDMRALPGLETVLDDQILAGLDEAEFGSLTLTVAENGRELLRETRRIEMLARDEWGGLGEMAPLLAAYVSPNDAVVAGLLKEAADLLEAAGMKGAIDGYQSGDPGRAWMLAGAIWSAATAMGLSYAVPPASFEARGQKIRTPARIRAEGLATCLDSALLLAAAFEAAGLNPVVLFAESHAWVGVWLSDRDFGAVTEPDVMAVRKAVDARELVLLETTLLCERPAAGFEAAALAGRDPVAERNEHAFAMAVDIRRARAARIRPLASHRPAEEEAGDQDAASPAALPKPLDLGFLPGDLVEEEPDSPADRISRWQRKLLDLSLRNRLLNFRDTKQTLPLLCPDVALLEDQLAGGRKFRALALKEDSQLGARDLGPAEEAELLATLCRDAFEKGRIAVPLTAKDTEARLLALYRRAKSDMQEGGTSTLFLAAGFLRWKKSEGDSRSYRAPMLLIPVRITRRSAQSDFVIETHEDEVRFNATLLEFLKRDFDLEIPELEGELPRDGSGYDLPLIFEILRRKVRDIAGFEVVEDLAMSTFSFAKFLMWKDLVDRTASLRESPLVRHLVDNPAEPFLAGDAPALPRPEELDRRVAPADLFTPLPADSSQLAAVLAAQEGHDFVLIGPPGTGKSQTIANMIAQCLAAGKTVLFVAEKSAALDVVHRRLTAHGLADAVLELHSNKSDRKSVLDQLGRSWDRAAEAEGADWAQVTGELAGTRDTLNQYVAALHRSGSQGFSVYQAIGRAAGAEQPFALSFAGRDAHDAESYARLERLAAAVERCHEIVAGRPPLELVAAGYWSFAWQAALFDEAETLAAATRALAAAAQKAAGLAGLQPDPDGAPEHLDALATLAAVPETGEDVGWALERDTQALEAAAADLARLAPDYRAAGARLSADYPMDRLERIPLDQLDADWRRAQAKIWPLSALALSSLRKLLQTYATGGRADPERDIPALAEARELRAEIDALPLTGCPAFDGAETDEARLTRWTAEAAALRATFDGLAGRVADPARWLAARQSLAARGPGALREALTAFRDCRETWTEAAAAFAETAGQAPGTAPLASLAEALETLLSSRAHLEDWTRWVGISGEARAAGLAPLVDALEDGRLQTGAARAFAAAYAAWWLPLAMDDEPCLRGFSHWRHEDAIRRFRELETRAAGMAAPQVMARIRHGLPARDSVPRRSELGVLRHQLGLQRPSLPIRTLISEMPDAFTRLAPCVLMSPLSVAQYLPAGHAAFDLVIFDEASQITTWDAIGAIARGRQAVIVGDPKQLPPTNFFGRSDDSEEELPETEKDLASILDEVASAGIPTRQLDWHYRSRDEALIAFSNWHYYGGRLVTFPSPATETDAVQLHQIDGTYGRGRGRTNEAEARAIVRLAVDRMARWLELPEEQRQTLGVITFNAEQQALILDLFDEERRRDPALEWFFEEAREEPVIVKNLENIQGDERDVMLFSITFGPDAAGRLSMAFGALNGDGGEKRLNVAVTRARCELHVFASIRADQIDLERSRALGVRHLKGFLDYAARGSDALPATDEGSVGPVANPFEAAVKAAIEAKGWELRPQIGVSGFRIDLGVVHPDHAGVYLAGIECDGATYHSSATARDRDKVRQAVLENLGWTIFRIWSTDWFKTPGAVAERMHETLVAHLEADRTRRAADAEARAARGPVALLAAPEEAEPTLGPARDGTAGAEEGALPAVEKADPAEAGTDLAEAHTVAAKSEIPPGPAIPDAPFADPIDETETPHGSRETPSAANGAENVQYDPTVTAAAPSAPNSADSALASDTPPVPGGTGSATAGPGSPHDGPENDAIIQKVDASTPPELDAEALLPPDEDTPFPAQSHADRSSRRAEATVRTGILSASPDQPPETSPGPAPGNRASAETNAPSTSLPAEIVGSAEAYPAPSQPERSGPPLPANAGHGKKDAQPDHAAVPDAPTDRATALSGAEEGASASPAEEAARQASPLRGAASEHEARGPADEPLRDHAPGPVLPGAIAPQEAHAARDQSSAGPAPNSADAVGQQGKVPAAEPGPRSPVTAAGIDEESAPTLTTEPGTPEGKSLGKKEDSGSTAAPSPSAGAAVPDPERFYDPDYGPELEALIAEIVRDEGPLPLTLLGRRVAAAHGWQRTGRRIAERVRNALGQVELHPEEDTEFVWELGRHAIRVPFRPGLDRALREISRSEIAGLCDAHAAELDAEEDPPLLLARLAGISRLSSDARSYLEACLAWRRDTGGG